MPPATIALIGTLDTKGDEFAYVRDVIQSYGLRTLVIDAGVLGEPTFSAEVSRAAVAEAANESLEGLIAAKDRGRGVAVMAAGATAVVRRLYERGELHGIVGLGGSAGTTRIVANRAATVRRLSRMKRATAALKRFCRRPDGS